jgi:hypothetical protein
VVVSTCAAQLGCRGDPRCNSGRRCVIDSEEPEQDLLDLVAPELERGSALAGELARLLLPAALFT